MAAVSNGRGKTLAATGHTKWPFVLLSILMSSLSLLSKEQGVTVIGVCAAFDVFLNWDHVWCSLSRKRRDSHDTTSNSELISQQTNYKLTKASIATNSHVNNGLHVNGISSKLSTAKKNKKLNGVRNPSLVQNMAQRIGGYIYTVGTQLVISNDIVVYRSSSCEWPGTGVFPYVNELRFSACLQTI